MAIDGDRALWGGSRLQYAAASAGQVAGLAGNSPAQHQAHATAPMPARMPAAGRRDRAAGAWEPPPQGRHFALVDPGTVVPCTVSPGHEAELSTVSTQARADRAGLAGAPVAPSQRPVRPPVEPQRHAPSPEEEDLAELFLPQPDSWQALDAAIRKRHADLLADLDRLRHERKAALEARLRDAIERGDEGLARLLRDMLRDVDHQFRALAQDITSIAYQQLEEVWRRPDGPKGGAAAEEIAALRQELETQRAALRQHVLDTTRGAGERNCTPLLALLAQWQTDAEDSLHQQIAQPLTLRKQRLKGLQESLAAARARVRLLLHNQMRIAHETQETGLWNLLEELEQRAEEHFLELAGRIK